MRVIFLLLSLLLASPLRAQNLILLGAGAGTSAGAACSSVSDSFTGSNGTSLDAHALTSGGSWTEVGGSAWEIQSNHATDTTDGTHFATTTGCADGTLVADLYAPSSGGGFYAFGLTFRYTDASNQWGVGIERDGSGNGYLFLFANVAGFLTICNTATFASAITASPVTVTTVMSGTSITVSTNTGEMITSLGSCSGSFNSSATTIGLNSYSDSTAPYLRGTYDAFSMTP